MPHRAFDTLTVRCPKLGGEVTFGYCRALDDGLPCTRALVCFELAFPVVEYFVRVLTEETFRRIFVQGGDGHDRVQKLLEEVRKAKQRIDR